MEPLRGWVKKINMYADNNLLVSSSITIEESVSSCQSMLDNIVRCCDVNKLTFNGKKANVSISTVEMKNQLFNENQRE